MLAFACCLVLAAPASHAALEDELREANRLHRQGQSEAALQRIDRWLAAQPKDAQMRFLKSVVLADNGRSQDAAVILRQLAQDYPELPEPHNNLAAIHAAAGEWDKARAELEATLRLNPAFSAAHENLGDVYVMLASQSYARALAAEPANASLPRKIAIVRQLSASAPAATAAR